MESHDVVNARGLVRACEGSVAVLRAAALLKAELKDEVDAAVTRLVEAQKALADLLKKEEEPEAPQQPEAGPPDQEGAKG